MTITIYGAAPSAACRRLLANAGEDVLLVDKVAEHVDAINAHGLRISGSKSFTVPARVLPADLRGPLGLTFLAVKSQDTDAALDMIAPLAGPDTVVVSLQNGMNPPRIAERLGAERVVAAFVSFPADWQDPGHIEHGGAGNIWIGEIDGRITERLAASRSCSPTRERARHRQHLRLPLGQADRLLAALRAGGDRRDLRGHVRRPALPAAC